MKKLIKGLVIFLGIFTVLSLFITYISIQKNSVINSILESEIDSHGLYSPNKNITTAEMGIDLYGTYNQNDLIVNDLVENYNGVEVKIPQIEGLKDTSIQSKINKDMYERAYQVLNKYSKINYANYYVYANFANALSIYFYVGMDNDYENIYFNYSLTNGETLKLEDIFIKNTDITGIIRSSFYETMLQSSGYSSESDIISLDENELYKVVKGYMNSEDKVFAFTPAVISFYYNDYVATVKMIDVYDRVSIYTKYLTDESLYNRNDIGFKNIFTCATDSYDGFEKIEYGYLEENFWYDISILKDYNISEEIEKDKLDELKETIYNEVNEKVNEYREIAKNNPDKFYILFSKPHVNIYNKSNYEDGDWNYIYSNIATVNKNLEIFEMPIQTYEKIYKDRLIDAYRYEYFAMNGGAYLPYEENDDVIVTRLYEQKLYNYITGEEIINVEDIFYEDSNYMEIIEKETKEKLIKRHNCSEDVAETLIKTISYKLDGTQVNVTIPEWEDFIVIIYLDEFDVNMLKIFEEEAI